MHCTESHHEDANRTQHGSDRSQVKNPARMSDQNVKIGPTET
jgi:hypothetical protein